MLPYASNNSFSWFKRLIELCRLVGGWGWGGCIAWLASSIVWIHLFQVLLVKAFYLLFFIFLSNVCHFHLLTLILMHLPILNNGRQQFVSAGRIVYIICVPSQSKMYHLVWQILDKTKKQTCAILLTASLQSKCCCLVQISCGAFCRLIFVYWGLTASPKPQTNGSLNNALFIPPYPLHSPAESQQNGVQP